MSGIILFRRHVKACHERLALKLPPEAIRRYTNCDCPIHGYENNGKPIRKSLGTNDWKEAEALASAIAKNQRSVEVYGPTIEACTQEYLKAREHELTETANTHYNCVFKRLLKFCGARGITHMRELTVDLLETYKLDTFAGLKDSTKANFTGKLRKFLRDGFRRGWITENLAERVTPHGVEVEIASPFEDDEVERILEASLTLPSTGVGNHKNIVYGKHPETFRLLMELMLETGMRCGDAVNFNPKELRRGKHLWVYKFAPQKQRKTRRKKYIEAFISDRLKTAIDNARWFSPERPFLASGMKTKPGVLVNLRMAKIGEAAGVPDCRPHRLRDTFAVNKLLKGVALEDVSRLLGHSSVKVTETYYAKWCDSRTRRLEEQVAQSLLNS